MMRVKPQSGTPLARIRDRCRPSNPISNANYQLTNHVRSPACAMAIPQLLPSTDLNLLSNPLHNPDFPALSSVQLHAISNSASNSHANAALAPLSLSDIDSFPLSNVLSDNHFSTLNTCSSNYFSDLLTASNLISSETTLYTADEIPLCSPIPVDALSYIAAVYDQIFANLVNGSTPLLKQISSVLIRKLLLDHATLELQTRIILDFEQLHDFILEILRKTWLIS